jgi:hypothetical protein
MNLSKDELEKIKSTMEKWILTVDVAFLSDEIQDYLKMNDLMTPARIIANLTVYNEYRRGLGSYPEMELSPFQIGKTIDAAIEYIKEHEALNKAETDDGR